MEDDSNNLSVQLFQLDYQEFEGDHSGEVIHKWWKGRHTKFGITPADVGDPTLDGAANGRKAARLTFRRDARYCMNHNAARSMLKSIDKKDKIERNPRARKVISKFRRYSKFGRMPKYSKDLNKAQMQLMGKKHKLTLLNVTRWDRDIECLHNAVSVEPAADELCERVMAHRSFLAAQRVEDAGSGRLEYAAS